MYPSHTTQQTQFAPQVVQYTTATGQVYTTTTHRLVQQPAVLSPRGQQQVVTYIPAPQTYVPPVATTNSGPCTPVAQQQEYGTPTAHTYTQQQQEPERTRTMASPHRQESPSKGMQHASKVFAPGYILPGQYGVMQQVPPQTAAHIANQAHHHHHTHTPPPLSPQAPRQHAQQPATPTHTTHTTQSPSRTTQAAGGATTTSPPKAARPSVQIATTQQTRHVDTTAPPREVRTTTTHTHTTQKPTTPGRELSRSVKRGHAKGDLVKRRSSKTANAVREKISDMISNEVALKRAANEAFALFDEDRDGVLRVSEVRELLSNLAVEFNIPEPKDEDFDMLFRKFDNHSSHEMPQHDFERFYRFYLCHIRDSFYPGQLRVRRDFFIQTKQGNLEAVYKKEEKLGQGQFGIVFKVRDRVTNVVRCCKCISKAKANVPVEFIQNEIDILRRLDHPNIVKLYECFEDHHNLYLVFEYIQGEELLAVLLRRGKQGKTLSEKEAARLLKCILSAIAHCHANRVMHKDLKPENIMLLKGDQGIDTGAVKIIDFGLAEMFTPGVISTTAAGTPYYMAPEVFNHRFNNKCDVWSVGVLLYLMLTAHLPFDANSKEEYIQVVNNTPVSFPRDIFKNVSKDAISFIKQLLDRNVEARPTAAEALTNQWFELYGDDDDLFSGPTSRSQSRGRRESGLPGHPPPISVQRMGVTPDEPKSPLRRISKKGTAFLRFARKSSFTRICLNMVAMNLNYDAIDRAPEVFRALDRDHDGMLSEEDMARGLEELGVPKNQIIQIVDAMDTDDSGEISYTEFVAALVDLQSEEFEQMLWNVFRQFDTNGDGQITKDELASLLQSGGLALDPSRKARSVDAIAKELDSNGDGHITFDEFKKYVKSH